MPSCAPWSKTCSIISEWVNTSSTNNSNGIRTPDNSDACLCFQGYPDGSEAEVSQAASSAEAPQDGEPGARTQGCVRLCCHLSQECVQYPHRVHPLSPHLRDGRRPALQREVLLLLGRLQAHGRRVPVSTKTSVGYRKSSFISA